MSRPIPLLSGVGEDRLTLVKTLTDGVKIKTLHAKTRTTRPDGI